LLDIDLFGLCKRHIDAAALTRYSQAEKNNRKKDVRHNSTSVHCWPAAVQSIAHWLLIYQVLLPFLSLAMVGPTEQATNRYGQKYGNSSDDRLRRQFGYVEFFYLVNYVVMQYAARAACAVSLEHTYQKKG
jgi:hypothetical protein